MRFADALSGSGHGAEIARHPAPRRGGLVPSIAARLDELYDGLAIDSDAERQRLLRSFLQRSCTAIDTIATAIASGEIDVAERHAHGLKGMSENVGVVALAQRAAEVEDAARDRRVSELWGAADDLRSLRAVAEDAIQATFVPVAASA